jgi:hypothetical protein
MRSKLVGLIIGLTAAALALTIGCTDHAPATTPAGFHVLADNAGPASPNP